MILPEPSEEQLDIIHSIENNNLIVDSVAGSGKTTLNLHIARELETLEILLLTYNARLKEETRCKATQLGISNLEIHSYHSFAVKYLNPDAFTDEVLKRTLENGYSLKTLPYYDLIIIDEAQDLTPLYYKLVALLYHKNPLHAEKGTRLCVVGDKYQSIYAFQNADPRMITLANYHFNWNHLPWQFAKLSTSFRVSIEVSNFLNYCCLQYKRLTGSKTTGARPRYVICDSFCDNLAIGKNKNSTVYREFERYLNLGYKPENFFVLAPSIRSAASPVRQLANRLTKAGVPVFVPFSDEEKIDEKVINGKVVFSSFHQVKGLERAVVLVFNFDESYFKFYGQDLDPTKCPNEIYVALTRSLEHLSIFHHYQNDYLPFLAKEMIPHYADIIASRPVKPNGVQRPRPIINTSVTDLIRHLPLDLITSVNNYFTIKKVRPFREKIVIPCLVPTSTGFENVSDINGTAIPAYFEYLTKKSMSIYQEESFKQISISRRDGCQLDGPMDLSGIKIDPQNGKPLTVKKLLKIANHWNSFTSGYHFKLNQITEYNWLTRDQLKLCKERLVSLDISKDAKYEYKVQLSGQAELHNRQLVGFIDLVDNHYIYEFKCVEKLQTDHYLQLAVYMYLFLSQRPLVEHASYHFCLYNILTDELDELVTSIDLLRKLMDLIIRTKYFSNSKVSDQKFLDQMKKIIETITVK